MTRTPPAPVPGRIALTKYERHMSTQDMGLVLRRLGFMSNFARLGQRGSNERRAMARLVSTDRITIGSWDDIWLGVGK